MNWLTRMLLPWEAVKYATKKTKKTTKEGEPTSIKTAARKDNNSSIYAAIHNTYGRFIDPLYNVLGENYMEFTNEKLPTAVNKMLSPIVKASGKLDPLRYVGGDVGKGADYAGEWVENKPLDTIITVLGAVFGGMAAAGAGGGAAGAGAGTAGGSVGAGMSAFGPYASGYVFPATSTFGSGAGALTGAGSAAGAGMSAVGPYASGYILPQTSGAAAGGSAAATTPASSSGGMFDFSGADWSDPNTYMRYSKMMPRQQQGMMQQQPSNQMYMNAQAQQGPMTLQDLLRVYGLEPYSNS